MRKTASAVGIHPGGAVCFLFCCNVLFVAAAMTSAAVAAAMMFMIPVAVMVAMNFRVIVKRASKESFNRLIGITGDAAAEFDPVCCQRSLCASANTAANQDICIQGAQYASQCTMALAVRADNF